MIFIRSFILVLHLLATSSLSAQEVADGDFVESSKVIVVNGAGKSYRDGSPQLLQKMFGKATVTKSINEMADGLEYKYKYNGLTVSFWEDNKLKSWEDMTLTRPNYKMSINGKIVRVNDKVSTLEKVIPISYRNRSENSIHVGLKHGGNITDAYIVIRFDKKGSITEIWIGNDNS